MSYQPLYIRHFETGLVQNRVESILPDDAYPVLENAIIFRETIKRRQGLATLGRFKRSVTVNNALTAGSINLISALSLESTSSIVPGTLNVVGSTDGTTYTDTNRNGTLTATGGTGSGGQINYATGIISINAGGGETLTGTVEYYPGLPVMGLRLRELTSINVEQTVGFDTKYAYVYSGGWREFIPGTTWSGTDYNFFWSTNYWVSSGNVPIMWVTNFSGALGDPIRYTNGSNWVNFAPQIDASANLLTQALALLPFRGRLLAFNTLEGANLATSVKYPNRIRWSAIGNPFTTVSPIVASVNPNAWRDDIRGQGGYLDIPTSQAITAVGFVRDNLVIYCERSTWQLRYTGRSIAPFQIEKVNSELGAESTFSAVQFDTSLIGIGDKGVVECDSFKSVKIDIKIPDLVFEFKNNNNGLERVQGIRDLQQRLAYWTYVYNPGDPVAAKYPNRRLVYNYENDSWGIYTDSLTSLGTFQAPNSRTWADSTFAWSSADFPWLDVPAQFPSIIGGNQQGYVMYLSSNLQPKVSNDPTLFISNITGNGTTPTSNPVRITSPNHNLFSGQVIKITGLISTDPFYSLNNGIYGISIIDANNFDLYTYSSLTQSFTMPALANSGTYKGQAEIRTRDSFRVQSKKFNYLDMGENIQMGYLDLLLDTTSSGEFSLFVYLDYNNSTPINTLPQNINPDTQAPDGFFNVTVPTTQAAGVQSSKSWQRIFCPARGNFITLVWTLSNQQLTTVAQESDIKMEGQILWRRPAGKRLVNV